jgi:hypothetical protein
VVVLGAQWSHDRLCSDSGKEDVGARQLVTVQASVGQRGDVGRLRRGREEMEATGGRSSPSDGHGGQEKKFGAMELRELAFYRLLGKEEGGVVRVKLTGTRGMNSKAVATCSGQAVNDGRRATGTTCLRVPHGTGHGLRGCHCLDQQCPWCSLRTWGRSPASACVYDAVRRRADVACRRHRVRVLAFQAPKLFRLARLDQV